MGNVIGGLNLAGFLGWEHCDPAERKQAWSRAGVEARRYMPRCEAIARATGVQCDRPRCKGQKHCWHHLPRKARRKVELRREIEHRKTLYRGDTPFRTARAVTKLQEIARRRFILDVWPHDPHLDADLLRFANPDDEQSCWNWLKSRHNISSSENLPGTEHPPTPLCCFRLLWAAWRIVRQANNLNEALVKSADYRVRRALRREAEYWQLRDTIDNSNPSSIEAYTPDVRLSQEQLEQLLAETIHDY